MANEKRLIDANELAKLMCRACNNECSEEPCEPGECFIYDAVCNAPTVDAVEVVHGRWEYGKWENGHWVKGNERCRCSVCHRDFAVDNLNIWHGCPQCLAKMDGGNEDG